MTGFSFSLEQVKCRLSAGKKSGDARENRLITGKRFCRKCLYPLKYKVCVDLVAGNYQVKNRLGSGEYQAIIRSVLIIIRRYHANMTPRLAPAAPALASSRPCSVDFSQPGSGCSNRRSRSPRDRRAARHTAGRYCISGPASPWLAAPSQFSWLVRIVAFLRLFSRTEPGKLPN